MNFNKQWLIGFAIAILFVNIGFAAEPVRAVLTDISQRPPHTTVSLPDASGNKINLDQYRGKVVLLDFWATWCGGCKQELPWFADFETSFGPRGFSVVAISTDEDGWPAVNAFVRTHQTPRTILLDDGTSTERFHIESMPLALLIDRHGKLAAKYVGLVDRRDIQQNIDKLLRER
jgi:thiol-disulfide isomerase/thioredoxin